MAERAWQRMLSGRRVDLLDPSPLDIEIEDIAHGLSRVARWNGQTAGRSALSVAQHSLLVESLAYRTNRGMSPALRLATLLHDSPEYVIGDLISPFKAAVGLDYRAFEKKLLAAIHIRFGLPATLPQKDSRLIKRADRMAAFLEATQLAGFSVPEARRFFGRYQKLPNVKLEPMPATRAKAEFLRQFKTLSAKLPYPKPS